MPALSKQFNTGIPFHQPPRVPVARLPFDISIPRLPRDKTPTEDPVKTPRDTGKESGRGASGAAGASAGAGAGRGVFAGRAGALGMGAAAGAEAGAGQKSLTTPEFGPAAGKPNPDIFHGAGAGAVASHPAPSFWDRLEEPFNPNSGVNQGFKRQIDNAGHTLAGVGHDLGNWGYDVFSPNASYRKSGWSQDIDKVLNFGSIPLPGSGGPAPASPYGGGDIGHAHVPSAIGEPQNGVGGFSQGTEFKAPTSWGAVGDDALSLLKLVGEGAK